MKIHVVFFWVMMVYSNVVGYEHFGGWNCFHLQSDYVAS